MLLQEVKKWYPFVYQALEAVANGRPPFLPFKVNKVNEKHDLAIGNWCLRGLNRTLELAAKRGQLDALCGGDVDLARDAVVAINAECAMGVDGFDGTLVAEFLDDVFDGPLTHDDNGRDAFLACL